MTLDAAKGSQATHTGLKRPYSLQPEIWDPDSIRDLPYSGNSPGKRKLYDPRQSSKGTASPYQGTPEPPSEWSLEANRSQTQSYHPTDRSSPAGKSPPRTGPHPTQQRQAGLIELQQRYDPRYPNLLLQPDSRPISQEQLASEVKSIYAGLTMVETKCIQVDRAQAMLANNSEEDKAKSTPEHWQALIALHRTLLHEHHDFFLASQHPSASPALRRLAAKYSMPARMWKHGIHSFLELLRRKLPESMDFMLAFIYLAYQMMALLYETVPAFEDTWIECLGDLGRYRMAIEDEDVRDRETWAGVARSWYNKAADKNPAVGRLYHHLAILARPDALQQLFYYARSLTCVRPFASARESILTLLDPALGKTQSLYSHALPAETSFIVLQATLFKKLPAEDYKKARLSFLNQLDNHIGRITAKWKVQGVYIAITNIAGLFNYGTEDSILRQALLLHAHGTEQDFTRIPDSHDEDFAQNTSVDYHPVVPSINAADLPTKLAELAADAQFKHICELTMTTFSLILKRIGDKNVIAHVHVMLSFFCAFASIPSVAHFIHDAPWTDIANFLNTLVKAERGPESLNFNVSGAGGIGAIFPPAEAESVPLPEDYLLRGQIWSTWYFPSYWFASEHAEEDRYLELASTMKLRTQRVLGLGSHLSTLTPCLSFDSSSHTFSAFSAREKPA